MISVAKFVRYSDGLEIDEEDLFIQLAHHSTEDLKLIALEYDEEYGNT